MTEDKKRLSMADEGASFTYAAPKEPTPLETGPFVVPTTDRARIIGTEELKAPPVRSPTHTFTRSEIVRALKTLHAARAGLSEAITAFENME